MNRPMMRAPFATMRLVRRGGPWLPVMLTGLLLAGPARSADPPAADRPAVPVVASGPSVAAGPRPPDRLDLDTTSIRGNQELPKVLYIVPWKEPGLAQPAGRPLNSLVDEALSPVDREVFRRQMRYFDQLYARSRDPGVGAPVPADD